MPSLTDIAWTALRWTYAFWFFSGSFVMLLHQFTGRPEFPRVEPEAQALLDALRASQFLYPLLALSYFIGGAALFRRVTAPLGLVILAAPTVVIVALHVFASGRPFWGALVGGAFILLAWRERQRFVCLWRETSKT